MYGGTTMEKRRSFKQLKTQMSATEFQSMAKKIAKDYANSEQRFSRSYFTEEYQISSDCFYKIIDYAIVDCKLLLMQVMQ